MKKLSILICGLLCLSVFTGCEKDEGTLSLALKEGELLFDVVKEGTSFTFQAVGGTKISNTAWCASFYYLLTKHKYTL